MCQVFGVEPANGMEVNAWICAAATDRDLEYNITGYWFNFLGTIFEYVINTSFWFYFSGTICEHVILPVPVLFLRVPFSELGNYYQLLVLFLKFK